jgi:hypothetical protein
MLGTCHGWRRLRELGRHKLSLRCRKTGVANLAASSECERGGQLHQHLLDAL